MEVSNFIKAAKAIDGDLKQLVGPPPEGRLSRGGAVLPVTLTRNTRGYIEKVSNQANGCYENGWYDSCAVMLRRLLETLIIECFEQHRIDYKIKNSSGDFIHLRDLIDRALNETSWNLSRSCKQAMPRLKDIGDKSAHSRRFVAQRSDIESLIPNIRLVVQELLFLAALK